jgi:hypothetical protein
MESNIRDQQFWTPDSPPAQPHFDEEATLLSARPVVPIREITAKAGFSRPWVLGIALVSALLLGVTATAFYYSRLGTTELRSVTSIEAISSGVEGVASEPIMLNEIPEVRATESGSSLVDSNKSAVDSNKPAKLKTQTASVRSTSKPLNSSIIVHPKPDHRQDREAIDPNAEAEYETRDERRAARREAKKLQRVDRERRVGKRSNEVLRIREIFEGPARP